MTNASSTCTAIRTASTESEVVTLVRQYLATLSAEKTALVPPTLLALGINHAREIAQAAVEVASREALSASDAPEAQFLKDVGMVLSTAAMRLVVLACGAEAHAAQQL
jgi:hypothetical protein